MSSHLPFHIFISSTHYNLVDLRAELARYLTELGYHPMVSSEPGFPEHTPEMNPWESCLRVVEDSHLVVLILDGRYGASLPWNHFKGVIDDKISPTHGEYRMAHHLKKRMLVFVRSEMMATYQVYRQVVKSNTNEARIVNHAKVRSDMKELLPPGIELEALEFLNEVKTTQMIPWILEFKDLTDIKTEIKHQMVNQLVEAYKQKEKSLEVMVDAFDQVLQELTEEKQQEVLGKLGLTKNLLDELEQSKLEAKKLRKSLQDLKIAKQKETVPLKARELAWTENILQNKYRSVLSKIGSEQDVIFNRVTDKSPAVMSFTSFSGADVGQALFQAANNVLNPLSGYNGEMSTVALGSFSKLSEASNYLFQPITHKVEAYDWSSAFKKNDSGNYIFQNPLTNTPPWAVGGSGFSGISSLAHLSANSALADHSLTGMLTVNPGLQVDMNTISTQLYGLNHMEVTMPSLIPDGVLYKGVEQDLFKYHKHLISNTQFDGLRSMSDISGDDKATRLVATAKKDLPRKSKGKK